MVAPTDAKMFFHPYNDIIVTNGTGMPVPYDKPEQS